MRRMTCAVVMTVLLAGCGGRVEGGRQYLNTMPVVPPQFAGTLDFDLLDTVVGKGCAELEGTTTYSVMMVGSRVGSGSGLIEQSEAAAVVDALSKIKDAETMLVTRSISEGDTTKKVCTTVFGRAIRLKKGPTMTPATSPAPAPAAPPGDTKGIRPSPGDE